jgi:hypothetical protein
LTNASMPKQLTAYMLVNNAVDLGQLNTDSTTLGATYALGRNIDATSFTGFTSGTTFTGVLDGNGGLGTNYTVSNLTLTSSQSQNAVGLFPFIGADGTVRNLNLANVNVTAGASTQNIGPVAGENDGTISNVTVTGGSVSGGSFIGIGAGGLTGLNKGLISGVSTNVTVSVGNASSANALDVAGGIAATNQGVILSSAAKGNVSGGAFSWVGGVAGQNGLSGPGGGPGVITSSSARGNVSITGLSAVAGGLVGYQAAGSGILNSQAFGNVGSTASGAQATDFNYVGGLLGRNFGTLAGSNTPSLSSTCTAGASFSCAAGNVSVGSLGWAGGAIGENRGTVGNTLATGNVTGGANSVLGGLAGGSDVGALVGLSAATGGVSSNGAGSVVAGLIGANGGFVDNSRSLGAVSGTASSYLGGAIGINLGLVANTSTTSSASVTGTGSQDVAGGFVGMNLGAIDSSTAAGNVSAGANSIVGSFAGVNGAFNNFQPGQVPGSFPTGTISSDSTGSGTATGGPGSSVGPQVGQNFASAALPAFPTAGTACGNAFCTLLGSGTFAPGPAPGPGPSPSPPIPPPSQTQIIDNLTSNGLIFAALTTGELVNLAALNNLPPARLPGLPGGPPPFGGRFFVVPPPGAPFVKDEVILQIPNNIPLDRIEAILRRLHLTILDHQTIGLLGLTTYRVHIDNGSPVATVIRQAAAFQIFVGGQANLIYLLAQGQLPAPVPAPAPDQDLAGRTQEGDAAQYALGKLGVIDVHRQLRGGNVTIAVIDSEIDVQHPDLDGVIAEAYDAVGKEEAPHPHGTGMAGAIAAHRRLMGIAPSARLYAVHAFSSTTASAESTTFAILKGLDWAAQKGARVINMSFAGPRDPSIERALKAAHDRNIVLIAAAGNAGPKSPPLYPGADPNVIAVTATDADDKLFSGANRGRYIAVAAPGVDILVPGTDAGYQLTTGTSVASAEVSGVAALLLERNPKLTPDDVRKILTTSARQLGSTTDYGAGLVDLAKAVQAAGDFKSIIPAKR